MMATGFAQNGAKVYIAARKEQQLKEVRNPTFPRNPKKLSFFSFSGRFGYQQGYNGAKGRLHCG